MKALIAIFVGEIFAMALVILGQIAEQVPTEALPDISVKSLLNFIIWSLGIGLIALSTVIVFLWRFIKNQTKNLEKINQTLIVTVENNTAAMEASTKSSDDLVNVTRQATLETAKHVAATSTFIELIKERILKS